MRSARWLDGAADGGEFRGCVCDALVSSRFALLASAAFAADDLAVDVQNASEPTLCAEKDNVYLKLASPEVRQFKIPALYGKILLSTH